MKKSILILPGAVILMAATFIKSPAQFDLNNRGISSDNSTGALVESKSRAIKPSNLKAKKNFDKAYHNVTGAEWLTLQDRSLMCRFYLNNTLYRAFYTAQGNWIYTISGYDGSKLTGTIRDEIKSEYYNYSIVFVNQIDLARNRIIYIAEIHDEKSIKKLRIDNDEMEVIQEFEKH